MILIIAIRLKIVISQKMDYVDQKQVTFDPRCSQCRQFFISNISIRYYCCKKMNNVCQRCSINPCKKCYKQRTNIIKIVKCSCNQCKSLYIEDDMFCDFQRDYMLCPKCLIRNYFFVYSRALKDNKFPDEVTLDTQSTYPYKDLVQYSKKWCLCCANLIGKYDAFELRKGARICLFCVELNLNLIEHMIKCIKCQGFIHHPNQISERYQGQVTVLCTYCKKQPTQEIPKHQIKELKISTVSKKIVSAHDQSIIKSKDIKGQSKIAQISKISHCSIQHSAIKEMVNLPLAIVRSNSTETCSLCLSMLQKEHTFLLNREEVARLPYLKMSPNVQQIRLCFICFTQTISNQGHMIQFQTPLFRTHDNRSEPHTHPVKGANITIKYGTF